MRDADVSAESVMKGTCASRRALHALGTTGVTWGTRASRVLWHALGITGTSVLFCEESVVIAQAPVLHGW